MEIEDTEQEILLEPEAFADVGDGVLTIQKNGTDVGIFTANQKTDTTVNITVPVATSELTNDANFQNANDVANAISTHNQSSSAHQDIRQAITDEATARVNADNALQGQIDAITSSSDVVDIVGTYAELQAYDTQHLQDNDVIKVLQDETHDDAMTYWRWNKTTSTWTYIGAEGPYYTKSEANTLLDGKLDKSTVPDGFFDGSATITPASCTSVELDGALKLKSVNLLGDCIQSVEPTPASQQSVNVVTGTQTITVSDGDSVTQTFTVGLGAIELCKIRTFQDYIYKSGDDWYVHKTIDKVVFTGAADESWSAGNNNVYYFHAVSGTYTPENRSTKAAIISDYYPTMTYNQVASTTIDYGIALDSNNVGRFAIRNKDYTSTSTFKSWLQANNTTVYYPVETATDTKIVDKTLIGQLNAILTATMYSPTTTISSSGIAPAILTVEAFTEHLNSLLEIAAEPEQEPVTYDNFVGTDGVNAGTAGLVPAPATTDAGKFLKADGTWDTAGSSMNIVQSTGTSQTDVMSQYATTNMIYGDGLTATRIRIGSEASASSTGSIAIGAKSRASNAYSTAIGYQARTSRTGEVNIGSGSYDVYGHNNTRYRLLGGVYDGQDDHDAVTVGQVNSVIDAINAALSTNISHIGS